MLKGIVFDFDGVIIDSEKARYDAWQSVYTIYGQTLPLEKWILNIGRASYVTDPHVLLQSLTGLKLSYEELYQKAKEFEFKFAADIPALPGVIGVIDGAYAKDIPMAIASSSSRAWVEGHLKRLQIYNKFTTLVCREDTVTHKPSPEPYVTAVNRLGCRPEDAIAIEDSPLGIDAAISAGLKCIAVGCSITKELDLTKANLQLSSFVNLY